MDETHVFEKKSYRKAFGPMADLSDLAKQKKYNASQKPKACFAGT
ncbi:hypothetical protein [Hymenobacter jeongseonensis]|nr:hypothetical protein [Hymenobacter jeongseonensis]